MKFAFAQPTGVGGIKLRVTEENPVKAIMVGRWALTEAKAGCCAPGCGWTGERYRRLASAKLWAGN